MSSRDDGPVYYREIQKNAYLKRIPNEDGGSKLRPLGQKKPALKPMWTLLCVHNGRIPYLEQYPAAESPSTASHTPAWRASLRTARHVTASVRPRVGSEYDFLIDTDHGPLRMLAPDWDSMQDWVHTLRTKLHELKILAGGENVYCRAPAAPAPAAPRAPQRDPTSPLPPTPPLPPTRIPGIEITPRPTIQETQPQPQIQQSETEIESQTATQTNQEQRNQDRIQRIENPIRNQRTEENIQRTDENLILNEISNNNNSQEPQGNEINEPIDISNWEPFDQPSTSQEKVEPKKGVTKICGQNICLDDSILKRNVESTESDEEFFAEIDRIHDSVENLTFDGGEEFKQRLVVNDREKEESASGTDNRESSPQSTNITVIQVSNKPPHTAIPVMGPETNVFDFDFKRNLSVQNDNETDSKKFVNIVNTEIQVQNTTDDSYGTVFEESPYGHLSLTTTVSLTGDKCDSDKERIYERLCLASTSNETPSPFPVRKVRNLDKNRKSSLPNLDNMVNSESPYEYLFPNFSQNSNNNMTNVTLNHNSEVNSNSNLHNRDNKRNIAINKVNNEVTISDNSRSITTTDISRNNVSTSENARTHNTSENLQSNNTSNNSRSNVSTTNNSRQNDTTCNNSRTNITTTEISRSTNETQSLRQNQNLHVNLTNSISVGNTDLTARVIRANVERSHSQNAYDSSPRIRDQLIRRVQRKSPKRDGKNDKTETQTKPIWKRGLTELSLLSRLRGIGQGKRQESPSRQENNNDRVVQSSVKVIHRSRPEGRVDYTRRRSSSLSNAAPGAGAGTPGAGVPGAGVPSLGSTGPLLSLRARQAAALRAEQRRAAVAARLPRHAPPGFLDYDGAVWIWWWGGARCGGRAGDRVVALRGVQPKDASHARQLVKTAPGPSVDILFHRVPLAKIFVFNKRDLETIGIKLDSECNITHVDSQSPAGRAAVPPPGAWAVTEVNNRPINLLKGGEEEMNRLSLHGTEVSILLQPSPLVKKLRAAMKANKSLLSLK